MRDMVRIRTWLGVRRPNQQLFYRVFWGGVRDHILKFSHVAFWPYNFSNGNVISQKWILNLFWGFKILFWAKIGI